MNHQPRHSPNWFVWSFTTTLVIRTLASLSLVSAEEPLRFSTSSSIFTKTQRTRTEISFHIISTPLSPLLFFRRFSLSSWMHLKPSFSLRYGWWRVCKAFLLFFSRLAFLSYLFFPFSQPYTSLSRAGFPLLLVLSSGPLKTSESHLWAHVRSRPYSLHPAHRQWWAALLLVLFLSGVDPLGLFLTKRQVRTSLLFSSSSLHLCCLLLTASFHQCWWLSPSSSQLLLLRPWTSSKNK